MPLPPAIGEALADTLALILPVDCAGCAAEDVVLCDPCRSALQPAVVRRTVSGFPVCSGFEFEGVGARVIRCLKSDGRTALARDLAPALAAALRAAGADRDVLVVPVPASRASYRRRGFRVPELVARRTGTPTVRMLRVVRQSRDQRLLGREERLRNVAGSLSASSKARGRRVVIIDDVVTSGATLAEAARALRDAGATVIGAATIASTRSSRHGGVGPETHR